MEHISIHKHQILFLSLIQKKHSSINVYAHNGTMIIYDKFTTLSSHETFTILGMEFTIATFNTNIQYYYFQHS